MLRTPTLIIALLTSLSISAQSYISYFTGNAVDVDTQGLGGICMMGGASEHDGAMTWFLNQANGGDVLVLRASGSDGYNEYMYSDLGVTLNSVETIVFEDASASMDAYVQDRISKAEAIWFAGGDQWNYVSYWRDTPVMDLINEGLDNRNIAIGGTSAGMAILGQYYFTAENGTVTSAEALSNPYRNDMTISNQEFLDNDILENVITDTHYDDPDRKGRHMAFLARMVTDNGANARGIACNEYTAVCIGTDGIATVYGEYPEYEEAAYFLQTNCEVSENIPENCAEDEALTWNQNGQAVKVYKVYGTDFGDNTFDLNDWLTGEGGEWQDWYVVDGVLTEAEGEAPDCVVSVSELDEMNASLYPNPVLDKLNIELDSEIRSITLTNVVGVVVFKTNKVKGNLFTLDVSSIPNGAYIVNIESEKGKVQKRVLKL